MRTWCIFLLAASACVTEDNVIDSLQHAQCEVLQRCSPEEFGEAYGSIGSCLDAFEPDPEDPEAKALRECTAAACAYDAERGAACVEHVRQLSCEEEPSDQEAETYYGCAYMDWWSDCDEEIMSRCIYDSLHEPG